MCAHFCKFVSPTTAPATQDPKLDNARIGMDVDEEDTIANHDQVIGS